MKSGRLDVVVLSASLFVATASCAWAQAEEPVAAPATSASAPASIKEPAPASNAEGASLDLGTPVVFLMEAPYHDEEGVANNIVEECVQLRAQLSESTARYLSDKGARPERQASVDLKSAKQALNIKITSAFSAGNAFIGHRKSVSVRAEFYKNGLLVAKTSKARNSSGGAFAGFKSSCSVLERTVNTLGNDIAKWLVGLR